MEGDKDRVQNERRLQTQRLLEKLEMSSQASAVAERPQEMQQVKVSNRIAFKLTPEESKAVARRPEILTHGVQLIKQNEWLVNVTYNLRYIVFFDHDAAEEFLSAGTVDPRVGMLRPSVIDTNHIAFTYTTDKPGTRYRMGVFTPYEITDNIELHIRELRVVEDLKAPRFEKLSTASFSSWVQSAQRAQMQAWRSGSAQRRFII